jgi:hypothetical protein
LLIAATALEPVPKFRFSYGPHTGISFKRQILEWLYL